MEEENDLPVLIVRIKTEGAIDWGDPRNWDFVNCKLEDLPTGMPVIESPNGGAQ